CSRPKSHYCRIEKKLREQPCKLPVTISKADFIDYYCCRKTHHRPMNRRLFHILILLLLCGITAFSQKQPAYVSGTVLDEEENPLARVSVILLGQQKGIVTNDSGYFRLKAPAGKAFALVFSYAGYQSVQKNFLLNE